MFNHNTLYSLVCSDHFIVALTNSIEVIYFFTDIDDAPLDYLFLCIITTWIYMPPSIIMLSRYNEVAFNTAISFLYYFVFVLDFTSL